MRLEELALLAEILGGVGVIASLLYLAFEVRKQGRLNRINAAVRLADDWSGFMTPIHDDAELSAIWLKGTHKFDELTDIEKLRFSAYFGRLLKTSESLYLQMLNGTLDKMTWRGIERVIRDTILLPGSQRWWKTRQHWYSDDFQTLIDRLISEDNSAPIFQTYELAKPDA
jgi:hypothetical protein